MDVMFPPGQVVATPGALSLLEQHDLEAATFLLRHLGGDWGDVCKQDSKLNDDALKDGTRILSSYPINKKKLWIITEADRSVTTLLLPEEY